MDAFACREGFEDALSAELKRAGKTQDEAIQTITDEMSAQYPDRNRLAGAIRAGYAEAK